MRSRSGGPDEIKALLARVIQFEGIWRVGAQQQRGQPLQQIARRAAGSFGGTIAGLRSGDTVDLVFTTATAATVNASDQLVITNNGAAVAKLQLVGDFSHTAFTVASDGQSGAAITLSAGAATFQPAPTVHAMVQAVAGLSSHGAPVAASFHNGGAARVNMLAAPAAFA